MILQTIDHYAKAAQQQRESQEVHDQVLTSYKQAEQNLRKDQAEAHDHDAKHLGSMFARTDQMMLNMDKGSFKLYERLLTNEVRGEESSEAVF